MQYTTLVSKNIVTRGSRYGLAERISISNNYDHQIHITSISKANTTQLFSTKTTNHNNTTTRFIKKESNKTKTYSKKLTQSQEPLYIREGLFSVIKPINWTSSNTVEYVRRVFELDARRRGVQVKGKQLIKVGKIPPAMKIGHGGTLDPLATGVLVMGIGNGTKQLKHYLSGTKRYRIRAKFGVETSTLDMEGEITKTVPYEHITKEMLQYVIPSFVGKIDQIPPLYSAIKQGGKKLYELARNGATEDEVTIPSRTVEIYSLQLTSFDKQREGQTPAPTFFELDVECGGGTYMRSLARDIAMKLGSVATVTSIERVKQGPFLIEDSLEKDQWCVDKLLESIDECKEKYNL